MNLLIAMMSQTYTDVYAVAKQEYQMELAKLVKEYYEATVFPMPLNVVEHMVDAIFRGSKYVQKESGSAERWGKHFTWPPSTLLTRLSIAKRKQAIKRNCPPHPGACIKHLRFSMRVWSREDLFF